MTVGARPLIDDVPGNIGLIPTSGELVRLHFREVDGLMPSDSTGGLDDLAPPAAHTAPLAAEGWTGRGRAFVVADPTALMAVDAADGDTLTTRDASLVTILALDLANATDPCTVYCRGIGGSTSERYALGLELENQGGANHGDVDVVAYWETPAGVLKEQLIGTFRWPGDGVAFLLTVTRRWVSTSEVVLRAYVDEQLIAEVTSVDGDIGGATTGTTSIGARRTAGTWGRYYSGVIEEILVLDRELSPQEVTATWARLSRHQPEGVERLQALAPPGAPWFNDRGNRISRLGKATGQALGLVTATADELLQTWLPDQTSAADIARWESLLGLAPRALDSLDTRRARVVAFLRRDNGYSLPQIRTALEGPFSMAAADIDIVEFTPTVTEPFTTLSTERWHLEPAARWGIASGKLRLAALAADDARWTRHARAPMHCRTPLYTASGAPERHAAARAGYVAQVNLVDYTIANPGDALVGLFLYNFARGRALWFGAWKNGGQYDLAYATHDGLVTSAFTNLASNIGTDNVRLRIREDAASADHLTLEWGTNSVSFDDLPDSAQISVTLAPDYVGLAALATATTLGGNLTVDFDDFEVRSPRSERAFHWYAMQDGTGSPDMIGANQVLRKLRPAHTHTAAITSLSLLCDNAGSGCDRGPLGGI